MAEAAVEAFAGLAVGAAELEDGLGDEGVFDLEAAVLEEGGYGVFLWFQGLQ